MHYKITVVGEAWGEAEEAARLPFQGASGYLLNQMLEQAGLRRVECYLTNVLNLRPRPSNDITNCCGPASEGLPGHGPIRQGHYLRAEYGDEIVRLRNELRELRPNLVLALGGTATWALLGSGAISKVRGTISWSDFAQAKVLPSYHPAAILRDWSLRHVTVLDFMKARAESAFREVRRPRREIWIDPTLEDLDFFYSKYLSSAENIAFDIETARGQITCIGFAPSPDIAIVVPFVDGRAAGGSYWPDAGSERRAWEFVRKVLSNESRKVGQNTVYDIHWLWRLMGITPKNYSDDTMLLHHSLQPESQKGLGFLGSVYSNEPAWKMQFQKGRGHGTIKKDS